MPTVEIFLTFHLLPQGTQTQPGTLRSIYKAKKTKRNHWFCIGIIYVSDGCMNVLPPHGLKERWRGFLDNAEWSSANYSCKNRGLPSLNPLLTTPKTNKMKMKVQLCNPFVCLLWLYEKKKIRTLAQICCYKNWILQILGKYGL